MKILEAYETWKSERSDFVVNIMRNMHDFSFARSKAAAGALYHLLVSSHDDEDDEASDMAGEDSDEDDLLGRFDSYDSEGGSQMLNDVWDADVDSDSVLGSNDLSPVLCPSCPMDSEHTKTIMTTLASTGILTGLRLTQQQRMMK
jgi:hypothetical protein